MLDLSPLSSLTAAEAAAATPFHAVGAYGLQRICRDKE